MAQDIPMHPKHVTLAKSYVKLQSLFIHKELFNNI